MVILFDTFLSCWHVYKQWRRPACSVAPIESLSRLSKCFYWLKGVCAQVISLLFVRIFSLQDRPVGGGSLVAACFWSVIMAAWRTDLLVHDPTISPQTYGIIWARLAFDRSCGYTMSLPAVKWMDHFHTPHFIVSVADKSWETKTTLRRQASDATYMLIRVRTLQHPDTMPSL
jgi:hypothetical protein